MFLLTTILSVGCVTGIGYTHDTGEPHDHAGPLYGVPATNYCETNPTACGLVSGADALPGVSSEEAKRLAALVTRDKVVFNEIFNASTDTHDWIELRNITGVDLSLDGWKVVIITGAGNQSIDLPAGTALSAGELLLLLNTDPNDQGCHWTSVLPIRRLLISWMRHSPCHRKMRPY